jgi:antibiotic biosynthesis monooxygenase (ABM) superfamily enzyme
MSIAGKLLPVGILFVITVGFGFWVSRVGKPYHALLFNIHKLVALGGVILTTVRIFRLDPFAEFPLIVIVLVAAAAVCVIATFATGAVMSIKEQEIRPILTIHQISPFLIVIFMGLAVYLLGLK